MPAPRAAGCDPGLKRTSRRWCRTWRPPRVAWHCLGIPSAAGEGPASSRKGEDTKQPARRGHQAAAPFSISEGRDGMAPSTDASSDALRRCSPEMLSGAALRCCSPVILSGDALAAAARAGGAGSWERSRQLLGGGLDRDLTILVFTLLRPGLILGLPRLPARVTVRDAACLCPARIKQSWGRASSPPPFPRAWGLLRRCGCRAWFNC